MGKFGDGCLDHPKFEKKIRLNLSDLGNRPEFPRVANFRQFAYIEHD